MTMNADYLEGLMEGFVAYDGNWRMTYMNAAAERILGRKRREVLGKTWHQAFPHAVSNPVDQMYQRVMAKRAAERMEMFYEHYGRWFEISAAPVQSGGVAAYFRDTRDRGRPPRAPRAAAPRKDEIPGTLAHQPPLDRRRTPRAAGRATVGSGHAGRGRRAYRAGPGECAQQCGEIHAAWRTHRAGRAHRAAGRRDPSARQRHRHCAGSPAAALPALRPGGQRAPRLWRPRHRPVHPPQPRRTPPRAEPGAERRHPPPH